MLRLLIGTGALLMAVGFGAAGWQYWQTLPKSDPAAAVAAVPTTPIVANATTRQTWMISPTGGLIAQTEVKSYLAQDRYVEGRAVNVTLQADLSDLLADAETLPDVEYLTVLSDIRAPRVAEGLCAVLLQAMATDCAVNSARVVKDSVDPIRGTASFDVELVYRLLDSADGLPDLAAHVLTSDMVSLTLDAGAAGTESAASALESALAAAAAVCNGDAAGQVCRLMTLRVGWAPGRPVEAWAKVAWLDPLPEGMFVAPPLTAVPND